MLVVLWCLSVCELCVACVLWCVSRLLGFALLGVRPAPFWLLVLLGVVDSIRFVVCRFGPCVFRGVLCCAVCCCCVVVCVLFVLVWFDVTRCCLCLGCVV